MDGRKAKYTIFIPQTAHAPGLPEHAQQRLVEGAPIDHCYIDPGKMAHWPGGQPHPHDLVVTHADDNPEMDSHVKAIAREVAQAGGMPTVFVVKEGQKGPMSWAVDNHQALA
jgi:hypothetical protein